jgi:hypothetical protein
MSRPLTPFDHYVRRFRVVHGDRYDYTPAYEVWIGVAHKIPIVCPVHGVFQQYPQKHLRGAGCPTCSRHSKIDDPADIAARVRDRYPHYELDQASYRRIYFPAIWSCTIHHLTFSACFVALLKGTARGCPTCRAQTDREQRVAKRGNPDAAANLARVSAVLNPERAELYRRWLAGETLGKIGQAYGVTGEAIRQRLLRVRALLQERPGTD